jgi:hypothetical protein
VALVLLASPVARAEAASGDVAAAARAYDEGLRAQLRRDWAQAADLFELADHLAPSAPALRSAIRNHQAAGHAALAVTLAARALERYPDDAETHRLADAVRARLVPTLGQLRLRCAPACALLLDGRAADDSAASHELYLGSGEHELVARFEDGRTVTHALRAVAGAAEELTLAPPPAPLPPSPPPPAVAVDAPAAAVASAPARAADRPSRRLPPLVFAGAAALTLGLSGALVWSGVDTLAARDRYVANPSEGALHDGTDRQLRTNVLIGAVAVLGVTSAAIAVFGTDWHHGWLGKRARAGAP